MTGKSLLKVNSGRNKTIPDDLPIDLSFPIDLSLPDLDFSDWDLVSIEVTSEQKEIIDRAIAKCRVETDFPTMFEGRALELICADYISG